MNARREVLERESRWAIPVAIATFIALGLIPGSGLLNQVSGDHEAEILRSVHDHSGSVVLIGLVQAVGFALLVFPLLYLFRAAQARSSRVRGAMVVVAVAAPLLLAVSGAVSAAGRTEAADQFVRGDAKSTLSAKEAKDECAAERRESGAKEFRDDFEARQGETPLAACERQQVEDDAAENAIRDASLFGIGSAAGLAAVLGLAVILAYSSLWAMRTGLLTRMWGSLGMAGGIAVLLGPLFLLTLVWFFYFGLLVAGRVPGGRPPAWAAGEAVPWPTPGERAAEALTGRGETADGSAEDGDAAPEGGDDSPEPRRKRKQRS